MPSNRFAFVAVAVACVAAAGGGSYLATRQNVASVAIPAAAASAPAEPVEETGALVGTPSRPQPVASRAAQIPASPSSPAAANRLEAPERPTLPGAQPEQTAARLVEQPPVLDRTWPGGPPSTPGRVTAPSLPDDGQPPAPPVEDRPVEVPRTPEPAARVFQELVVSADSVIGLQTEGLLSSERARVEDRVEARVVRDVRVNGEVAIPAGTRALGSVVIVERGGKVRKRARLGIRFQTLVLADGTRMPITTETIYRYGESRSNGSAARVGGGAVAGAILGAIIGGGKGAAIGATTGASAGTAAVMGGERSTATFPPGSEVTARILSPVIVTVERE